MELLFRNQLVMMQALMQINPNDELRRQIKKTELWLIERQPREATPEQIVDFFTRGERI
jgi:hypothetical protein